MDGIEGFDNEAFSLSQSEAINMDPQHRLILQLSGHVLSESSSDVDPGKTGVFVGISWTEYSQISSLHSLPATAYTAQGAVLSVCPGRVSFHYGLKGPSVAMDTACSSSLVAASIAREYAINSVGASLVSGINMILRSETTQMFKVAGMLSPDGRCKAFDEKADGYVRSEACAALILSSTDNDGISSVALCGAAINQDGRSSSLTAPNGPSQASVVREALSHSVFAPIDASGLQTHGTGTGLGDPIEVGAAMTCFQIDGHRRNQFTFFASKSALGHSEPASGIIGLSFLYQV